ncbi:hypothetical protein QBC41DRAFT_264172 [Cercophora samala]|uniref:NACHT domain-containing protein n=1 Tax=Cercophora samala TaxID=330535 RepID=A0AA39ZNU5_9PEZI|nr:hypothetical protein QBC41DRAFT_264172 [Cercophora samala]
MDSFKDRVSISRLRDRPSQRKRQNAGHDLAPGQSSSPDAAEQAGPSSLPRPVATPALPKSDSSMSLQPEHFWDQAYDALKAESPKLVEGYEKVLSRYLTGDAGPDSNAAEQNAISQNNAETRREQMERVIRVAKERTEKEARLKEQAGTVTDAVLTAKNAVSLALRGVPQASLPWAATCVALEMLANAVGATKASRKGITHIKIMMHWYFSLVHPLLKGEKTRNAMGSDDTGKPSGLKQQLGLQIVELYKAALSYEITFVCSCYRHRGLVVLGDLLKLENWDQKLKDVVDSERRVQESSRQYTALQMTMRLKELVTDQKTDKDNECLKDLRITDPRHDKTRIENTKGGLLVGSYAWILVNEQFQHWRGRENSSRLLWIKGDPGKGKTMLLCGIIDELQRLNAGSDDTSLAWFFCQATDSRINNATSVIRGLLSLLIEQQPSLISYVREEYDRAGKSLFEDANSWFALSELLTKMLQDPSLGTTYLVIDALDECTSNLRNLLDFLVRTSSLIPHVKWLISSRNELHIEQRLSSLEDQARLSLELKQTAAHVSDAVNSYIDERLSHLLSLQENPRLLQEVRRILREKANGTFLWVSLVCQELESPESWDPLSVVEDVPVGLYELYDRMMKNLPTKGRDNCHQILSFATLAFRPLHLAELACLLRLPSSTGAPLPDMKRLTAMCGSFLTIRDGQVYLVHQSAKDYLSSHSSNLFPSGQGAVHSDLALRSLGILTKVLHRDMYQLRKPDFSIDVLKTPSPDPLITARYSSIFWTDHLLLACSSDRSESLLKDGGDIHAFLQKKFLYWLESLSLQRHVHKAVIALNAIQNSPKAAASPQLLEFLHDAYRFTLYHRIIETCPLQIYSSALVFSPTGSVVRKLFIHEEPPWMVKKPDTGAEWDACVMSLDGHTQLVASVAFSHDGKFLASTSHDHTVKLWDTNTGSLIVALKHTFEKVDLAAFSPDDRLIISVAHKFSLVHKAFVSQVTLWNISSSQPVGSFEFFGMLDSLLFSQSGRYLALGGQSTERRRCRIWDLDQPDLAPIVIHNTGMRHLLAFSSDDKLAISLCNKIEIWTLGTQDGGQKVAQTIPVHDKYDHCYGCFSDDGQRFAFVSENKAIQVWDLITGDCLQTLYGHEVEIRGLCFSQDDSLLLSSDQASSKIWDLTTGECTNIAPSVVGTDILEDLRNQGFSPEPQEFTASMAYTLLWKAILKRHITTIIKDYSNICGRAMSFDCRRCATISGKSTVQLWDLFPRQSKVNRQSQVEERASIEGIALSSDGAFMGVFQETDLGDTVTRQIQFWDLAKHEKSHPLWLRDCHFGIHEIWFGNHGTTGRCLMSFNQLLRSLHAWDLATGNPIQLPQFDTTKGLPSFSNDGQHCAGTPRTIYRTSSVDQATDNIHLFDMKTGKFTRRLALQVRTPWTQLVFSPNDKYLAALHEEGELVVCEVASGDLVHLESSERTRITCMPVFSQDSSKIAGISGKGQVLVWNLETGQRTSLSERIPEAVFLRPRILAFSIDGTQLAAAAGDDENILLFDLATERFLAEVSFPRASTGAFLESVRYDEEDRCFHVNLHRQRLVLNTFPVSDQEVGYQLCEKGYGVSLNCKWVTKDGENLLRLPADYRPDSDPDSHPQVNDVQIAANTLVIATERKGLMIMKFAPDVDLSRGRDELVSRA